MGLRACSVSGLLNLFPAFCLPFFWASEPLPSLFWVSDLICVFSRLLNLFLQAGPPRASFFRATLPAGPTSRHLGLPPHQSACCHTRHWQCFLALCNLESPTSSPTENACIQQTGLVCSPVGVGRRVYVPAHHSALSMQDATRLDIQLGCVAVQDGPQLELDLVPHLPALGLKSFKTRRFRQPPDAWPPPSRPLRVTLASLCRRV